MSLLVAHVTYISVGAVNFEIRTKEIHNKSRLYHLKLKHPILVGIFFLFYFNFYHTEC